MPWTWPAGLHYICIKMYRIITFKINANAGNSTSQGNLLFHMHVHASGQESAISYLFVFWKLVDFLGNKKEYLLLYNQKKKILQSCRFFLHREMFGYQSAEKHPECTCCHDDSCEDFPSCMGGGEVVCQLTELIHHQAGHGISQNLESNTQTHMQAHRHKLVSDTSTYKASYVIFPWNTMFLSQSSHSAPNKSQSMKRQQVKLGWPPEVYLTVFQATLFELGMTVLIYHLPSDSGSQEVETRQVKLSDRYEQSVCQCSTRLKLQTKLRAEPQLNFTHIFCSWTATASLWYFTHS